MMTVTSTMSLKNNDPSAEGKCKGCNHEKEYNEPWTWHTCEKGSPTPPQDTGLENKAINIADWFRLFVDKDHRVAPEGIKELTFALSRLRAEAHREGKAEGIQEEAVNCSEHCEKARKEERERMGDAAEMLWVVLANVNGGDWTKQTKEWQEAAARWRDNYFNALRQSDGEKAK